MVQLHLPPLRERGSDILTLTRHFLQIHAARYGKPVPVLSKDAETALLSHAWPGNVRELRNVLEQAVLLGAGVVIEAHHLALPTPRLAAGLGLPGALGASPTIGLAVPTTLNDLERNALVRALDQTGWNVSRAARILGISRDTLRYRIEKHRLVEPPR